MGRYARESICVAKVKVDSVNNEDKKPILIPIIRQIMPSIVADIIANTQRSGWPFSYRKFRIVETIVHPTGKTKYKITIHSREILDWLNENYQNDIVVSTDDANNKPVTISEEIFILLKMKWPNE